MYIPPGFNTVNPYCFVLEAEKFIAFLVAAFGGNVTSRTVTPDGRVANAQVRIGTSTLMVSEASGRYQPMCGAFYLYVEDADAALQNAMDHGATLEMAVGDMPYGDRQGGVRDSHGNIWWLSQRTVHQPYRA